MIVISSDKETFFETFFSYNKHIIIIYDLFKVIVLYDTFSNNEKTYF